MTTTKIETAAEKYRRIKQERAAAETLHDFTSPSGMEWKLRRPNLAQFITSGVMPMDLAAKLAPAEKEGGDMVAAFDNLSIDEKVKTIAFSAKVVRYCAVVPRIVEKVTSPDEEIAQDELELDDFNAIFAWATTPSAGGDGADSLDSFRQE